MRDYVPSAQTLHHTSEPPFKLPPAIRSLLILTAALLVALPCLWQPHVQAGDFSSHIYNAWLTLQVQQGQVTGLETHWQWTNTLADLFLPKLLEFLGRSETERITAILAVEIFFWGAFFFISRVRGELPWLIAPMLAAVTYGTAFQLGFLNFHLSAGLSMWLMRSLWKPTRWRVAGGVVLAALALLAHPMPLAAALLALLYVHIHRRMDSRLQVTLLFAGLCALALSAAALASVFPVHWSWNQVLFEDGLLSALGVGQLWPFGSKYAVPAVGAVIVGFLLLLNRIDQGGTTADPLVHLWILSAAAVAFFPTSVTIPGYGLPLEFIPDRISLFVAVFFCAAVSAARGSRTMAQAVLAVSVSYFACLYLDARQFTRAEREIDALISKLPPGQRVVAAIRDRNTRFNSMTHIASGACIGHCYDYGNYEALSGMFRLRVTGPSAALPSDIRVVTEIEDMPYVVMPSEAPVYSICPARSPGVWFELKKIEAGQATCNFALDVTSQIF